MTAPITLPALATDILNGRHEAGLIEAALNAAFWLHGLHNGTALYLLSEAHARFAEMADAMGYTIAPKVPAENAATPARAKLEAAEKLAEAARDFATAKIDALRYQPAYGESPEDEPDPVVEAEYVWALQTDMQEALSAWEAAQ